MNMSTLSLSTSNNANNSSEDRVVSSKEATHSITERQPL